jgi:hypothetical protein
MYLNPVVWGIEKIAAIEGGEDGILFRVAHVVGGDGRPAQQTGETFLFLNIYFTLTPKKIVVLTPKI